MFFALVGHQFVAAIAAAAEMVVVVVVAKLFSVNED